MTLTLVSGSFVKICLALSLALICAGCAARQVDTSRLPVEAFVGHVLTTEDGSWFTPCGSAEDVRWWVTYVDTAVRQAREATATGLLTPGQRAFVRWRASRTDERLVGPGGPALLVRDLFEIRAPTADDCERKAAPGS